MSGDHLSREFLRTIFQGERPASDLVTAAMAHLFELCPHCRAELEAFHQGLDTAAAAETYSAAYEQAIARVLRHGQQLERERQLAARRLEELLRLSAEDRLEKVQAAPERYREPALAELLLAASRESLPDRPRDAYAFAQLARAVLQHCSASTLVIEIYTRALAHMANALRVMGRLAEAAERFDHARFLLRSHEAGDQLLLAELDHLEGSLRRDQRRLEEAVDLLARAVFTYREQELAVEEARVLLKLGMVFHETNEADRAIATTQAALARLEGLDEPRLQLMGCHNLAWLLQDVGRCQEARERVMASRELYHRFPDTWTQLRRCWLEGQIARGLGDAAAAEEAFLAVREGFLTAGMGYDAALVALDLASLYLEQRRSADVQRLAAEIVPLFDSKDIHREALAALMLFQDAARMEQLNLQFVRELASYLQAARRNPALPFRRPS